VNSELGIRNAARPSQGFRISNFEFRICRHEGRPLVVGLVARAWKVAAGLNLRRRRSELRPHPKEETMSYALAPVRSVS